MNSGNKGKKIFSVGGGKGGVGKSIFSAALGYTLAKEGHKTVIIDLDLGTANIHTYLGITAQTRTIAEFIQKQAPSLEEILTDTAHENLRIISGAEFVPGMANPAHWVKLKIIRHIRSLPADYIIIDLGAGVQFNTLDFFGVSDRGIVVATPEPGSIMNAYSFIKAALFRRLQGVYKKHPAIGPIIESETKKTRGDEKFTIEWLSKIINETTPDELTVLDEIKREFRPLLVVNRMTEGDRRVLVRNLISLCRERLSISLEHMGNLPDISRISDYLLDIPMFLNSEAGASYYLSIKKMIDSLTAATEEESIKTAFNDDEIGEIIDLMEGLEDSIFEGSSRNTWKLRMYFKPAKVINFLISRGVNHSSFYKEAG